MLNLNLDGKYIEFIKNAVCNIFGNVETYIFGSRVQNKSLEYSDIDIALKGSGKLDFEKLLKLRTFFHDSDFPYKVDILDLNDVEEKFYNIIKDDLYKIL